MCMTAVASGYDLAQQACEPASRTRIEDHIPGPVGHIGEEWSWCYVDEVAFLVQPGADNFAGDAAKP